MRQWNVMGGVSGGAGGDAAVACSPGLSARPPAAPARMINARQTAREIDMGEV